VRKTNSTNPELLSTIRFLKKQSAENKANVWRDIAERLAKPERKRIAVNLSRLNRYTKKNDAVAVPGKVLGAGEMTHQLTVAALAFSESARQKILAANGKCITFSDLAKKNPKGSEIRIIG
jgi:large subunit ribosomal protein L18e